MTDAKNQLEIESPRLVLRDFLITDWPGVHAFSSDSETVQYLEWGPYSEEETINFVLLAISEQREKPRETYHLAIVEKTDGPLVGSCSLIISGRTGQSAIIGYIISPGFRLQGYATESVQALLKFSFNDLRQKEIQALCDTRNIVSARVLEKAGLKRQQTLFKHKERHGVLCDSYLYAITQEEWKAKQREFPRQRKSG